MPQVPQLHKLAAVLVAVAVAVGLFAPPVGDRGRAASARDRRSAAERHAAAHPAVRRPSAARPTPHVDPVRAAAAARAAGANELGQVPILMIHHVVAKPSTSLDRTPGELYEEFTRLARENYVPVTAGDFATGRLDVPAGKHPVALTFDDGSATHLAFDASGNPRPDTAVGIIQRVAREHPGWRPTATFFVNRDPFELGPRAPWAVRWLVQRGYEVANHTTHHADLSSMGKAQVQREIGTDQKMIIDAGAPPPISFAFPYGSLSHLNWADHGTSDGVRWDFRGMFLAGWKPADPPFMKGYDPQEIPRIRSEGKIKENDCRQYCSTAWLDWLSRHPDRLYTSDGDPVTIAFPQGKTGSLAPAYRGRAVAY